MIYTAITGGYEKPRNDILVLTDDPFKDPRRSSRMHKCLPPKAEYSLWLDGNTSLKVSLDYLISEYLKNCDICVFKHPIRDCIYQEAKACQELKLDAWDVIEEQVNRYRAEGYPEHNGLAATTYVLRRHTPQIEALNNMWWAEICKGSKRDQLSFDYCCWKLGIKYNTFSETHKDNFKHNKYFDYYEHGNQRT